MVFRFRPVARARVLVQILAVLVFLGVAAGVVFYFVSTAGAPQKEEEKAAGALVRTETVRREERSPVLPVKGTVLPERQVQLRAQVPGKLTYVHPELRPGRRVKEGELLAEIERTDYELALRKAKGALKQARAELELEKGRQKVAEEEWEFFLKRAGSEDEGDAALALREPQLTAALARVQNAEAEVETAKLNLERTRIEAPFPAVVMSETAEVGQLVGTQTPIVDLIGSEAVRVNAAVPSSKLAYLQFPAENGGEGAPAQVAFRSGSGEQTWSGRILSLEPAVEPQGRMARVLIRVEKPFGETLPGVPLLLNAFVDVEIETTIDESLIAVPRSGVRRNDRVYVLEDGKLRIVQPEIVWRETDRVFVRGDELAEGDEVVVSPLASAVDGMPLRRQESDDVKL